MTRPIVHFIAGGVISILVTGLGSEIIGRWQNQKIIKLNKEQITLRKEILIIQDKKIRSLEEMVKLHQQFEKSNLGYTMEEDAQIDSAHQTPKIPFLESTQPK